jgi:hypothetical protein
MRTSPLKPAPRETIEAFQNAFPILDPRVNSQLKMLWIACGTWSRCLMIHNYFLTWLL